MLNFLRAEIWRYFRRPAGKVLMILSLGLPAALNVFVRLCSIWWEADGGTPYTLSVSGSIGIVAMPYAGIFLLMAIADAAFADENRRGTLRNTISAGISRGMVYFGKIAAGLLLSGLHLAGAWAAFFVSGFLLLPADWGTLRANIREGALIILLVLPLWLGVFGILYLLYFSFRNGMAASLAAAAGSVVFLAGIAFLQHPIAEWIFQRQLLTWFLAFPLEILILEESPLDVLRMSWLVGGGHFLICTAAGGLLFCRREIR